MRPARGEVTTSMVDLNHVSLADLRSSDDPMLLRSLAVMNLRMDRGRTEVLQNQAPDET